MEVIHFGTPNERPPLLFIHGAFWGAWTWEKFFFPAFAEAGWWGAAISLRGHGKNDAGKRIDSFGIADYLKDVEEGAALFDRAPILIGHSSGGYLAQKYALDHPVAGMVLLSAPSLLGLGAGSLQHVGLHSPQLAIQLSLVMTLGPNLVDKGVIGRALFGDDKSTETLNWIFPLLQRESSRFTIEAMWPDFRRPHSLPPTLVLAGDNDAFVPNHEFKYEANFWDGDLKILPGIPHGMMLCPRWQNVAKEIIDWVSANFPAQA